MWPVKGKLLKKYGVQKKITGLKWQGVLIGANHGSKVHAISDGKVVFADWFKNYGLLVIIDHNNDYLSLYGHNQQLLKVAGDSVKAREIEEEKKAMAEYGSSDSGASLGDILGAALKQKEEDQNAEK